MKLRSNALGIFKRFFRVSAAICCLSLTAQSVSAQSYQISTGNDFGAVIDDNGNLYVWGSIATGVAAGEIQLVEPIEVWQSVVVSREPGAAAHILAIRQDGTLWAWGSNDRGQLGDGTQIDRTAPVQVGSDNDWLTAAAGDAFSIGLKTSGAIFVWGDNTDGQLGFDPIFNDVDLDLVAAPTDPLDGNTYISIAAGERHAHAIRSDGTLWAWGTDSTTLGIGGTPIGNVLPTQVGDSHQWTELFGGRNAVFALQGGELYVWGTGVNLGVGTDRNKEIPVQVGTDNDWASLSLSGTHTLALKTDGSLYGWGSNSKGQLGLPKYDGNGDIILENLQIQNHPIRLEDPDTFLAVGAGDSFSALISSDGFMLTSGVNGVGQLANGQDNDPGLGQYFFANSQLGVADLAAISVTVNTPVQNVGAGQIISVSFEIQNIGTGEITDSFEIEAWLSGTGSPSGLPLDFDTGAGVDTSLEITDDFAAGQSRSLQFQVELPGDIPPGSYSFVVDADAGPTQPIGAILENVEVANNFVASEILYSFLPDLVVPTGPNGLSIENAADAPFEPSSDSINIDLILENIGNATVVAGTEFDLRFFFSVDQDETNSANVDLVLEETITLAADLIPGASVDLTALGPFVYPIPRMPEGLYYVGVEVDVNNDVAEQAELLDENNIVLQPDGEGNNFAFSDDAVQINGLDLTVSLDLDVVPEFLTLIRAGDGDWFGQDFVTFDTVDAGQSPALGVGESASFNVSFDQAVAISFTWRSETSSAQNFLRFNVVNGPTGGTDSENQISGDTNGWAPEKVFRVIPENALAQWTYTQGVAGTGDAVYVDEIEAVPIDDPDLVIDSITFPSSAPTSYVLQRDPLILTVASRNQGTSTDLLDEYAVSIYLSKNATLDRLDDVPPLDDILVDQFVVSQPIGGGDISLVGFTINLPTDIDPGDYYVIGYIDDYYDINGGGLLGLTGTGQIDEFTELVGGENFPGEDNNVFISAGPVINIVALPDLQADSLVATPDFYYIYDPATNYTVANEFPFSFNFSNQGLGQVDDAFDIKALLSIDENFDQNQDFSLLEFLYEDGLGTVTSGANSQTVSPDNADFRPDIVSAGLIGERLFFGVLADSGNAIVEFDEDNNSVAIFNNDLILSEFTLQDALDLSDQTVSDLNITILNDEVAPYDSTNVPWVGQSTETLLGGPHAAASVKIDDNETSQFSVNLDPSLPVRVSFWWKVSSQNTVVASVLQRDTLNFLVDGVPATPAIFGTGDPNWRRVEVVLDPGPHTLTWAYQKDNQGSAGEDRGWVDQLTITELPNLTVTGVSVDGSISYQGGDSINTWSVEIVNSGESIPANTEFDVEIRLLPNAAWEEIDAVTLLTITDASGINAGESRTYSNLTDGALSLPSIDYSREFYYFGAYVDWSEADPDNGQISESDESELDNAEFTSEASIQIGRPDLFGDASSINLLGGPFEFGDFLGVQLTLSNIGPGTLPSGTSFGYTVYISRTDLEDDLGSSSSTILSSGINTTLGDVDSGDPLSLFNVLTTLPYGLADGDYFIAVEIDTGNDVEEQGLDPDGNGVDGELNNIFFTSAPDFVVSQSESLYDGLNDGTSLVAYDDGDIAIPAAPTPYIQQNQAGAALWFGRDEDGDVIPEDNQVFADDDGAQSPVLQLGEFAEFSLTVPESSLVRFDWRVSSGSDQNILSVSVNGVEFASISGDIALDEIDPPILVPDGGVVTWRYSKGADVDGDFALIDNLRIESNNQPDLSVTGLNYTPGEYILDIAGIAGSPDQLLGTEYLDVTVEATNLGDTINAVNFTTADIEVRLSTDDIFGNDNDIVLGTFSQVEGDLTSGGLIRFIGPIQLGDSIPEGVYHLMARIDSNDEVIEFSEANNIVISENADVQVTRLPALRIYNPDATVINEGIIGNTLFIDPREGGVVAVDVDETVINYAEGPMRVRFSIQNIGLDRIEATESWTVDMRLVGALREDIEVAQEADPQVADALFEAFSIDIALGDFSVEQLMEGRSEVLPEGQILDFDIELALPSGARFVDIIEEDKSILDYLWALEIDIDANNEIRQSQIIREEPQLIVPTGVPWRILNPSEGLGFDELPFDPGQDPVNPGDPPNPTAGFQPSNNVNIFNTEDDEGAFGIAGEPSSIDEAAWEAFYGVVADATSLNPVEVSNFFAYAFVRNPLDDDGDSGGAALGARFPGTYGLTTVQDEEFLSITFDFVTRATDLVYIVQADDEVTFTDPDILVRIDGPFDQTDGQASLTGDGGLITGYIDGVGGDPEVDNVLTVVDQGYSARITVRDNTDVITSPTRFIRVVVDSVPTTPIQ